MSEPVYIALASGADENYLCEMMATLVRQSVDDHPWKAALLKRARGRMALVVSDMDVVVTMHFQDGGLTISNGYAGIPDVSLTTSSEWIAKMSLVELSGPLHLPDPRGEGTQAVMQASKDGEVVMHGLLRAPRLVLDVTRLLSVV